MKTFELTPVNGKKSFGGKCRVFESLGMSYLLSYDTVVASFNHETNEMKVYGWWSLTTLAHINSFLDYYGFEKCSKSELIEKYNCTQKGEIKI